MIQNAWNRRWIWSAGSAAALRKTEQIVLLGAVRLGTNVPNTTPFIRLHVNLIRTNTNKVGLAAEPDVVCAFLARYVKLRASSRLPTTAYMRNGFMVALGGWFRDAGDLAGHKLGSFARREGAGHLTVA